MIQYDLIEWETITVCYIAKNGQLSDQENET